MSIRLYGLDRAERIPEDDFEEIATLTRDVLGADGAGINLLVDDTQVTFATTAGETAPVPRDISVCSTVLRTVPGADIIEIPDLRSEPALVDNPFVDGRMAALRFYAAAPLIGKHGLTLGTLCAWSVHPQHLDDRQRSMLRQFGRSVVHLLDERRRVLVPDGDGALQPAR